MIIESSEDAAAMVNQIAAAATQQSSATEEVNVNISEIARISQETSSGARQSARACLALSDLALDLNQLISKFQVGEEQEGGFSSGRLEDHSLSYFSHGSGPEAAIMIPRARAGAH